MSPAKLPAVPGSPTMTIAEFSQWADISITDARAEIDAGRLHHRRIGNGTCIALDDAVRWMKARHGGTAPGYWQPLPADGQKINPFADVPLQGPAPISTIAL